MASFGDQAVFVVHVVNAVEWVEHSAEASALVFGDDIVVVPVFDDGYCVGVVGVWVVGASVGA